MAIIANEFKRYLFDLDGVLYIGEHAEPYAQETIEKLRSLHKEIRFITNNPCTTREMTKNKLVSLGIEAYTDEVITASSAIAQYLKANNLSQVLLLGDIYMKQELLNAGIHCVDTADDVVEAVVVGWSDDVTFKDVRIASRWIRKGIPFIAAGRDYVFPLPDGPAPATGVLSIALEKASGQKPTVIGKPFAPMFAEATRGLTNKADAVVIGDNLHTDIKGAHDYGLTGVLVTHQLSGAYEPIEVYKPDAVIDHLEHLFTKRIES